MFYYLIITLYLFFLCYDLNLRIILSLTLLLIGLPVNLLKNLVKFNKLKIMII